MYLVKYNFSKLLIIKKFTNKNNLYLVKHDISKQYAINCYYWDYNFYKLIHPLSSHKYYFLSKLLDNKISYNIKLKKINNYFKLLGFILTLIFTQFIIINEFDALDVITNIFKENIEYIIKSMSPKDLFHPIKENIEKISISFPKENINTENSFNLSENNLRPYVTNNFNENIIIGDKNIDINKINTTDNLYKKYLYLYKN